MIDKKMTFISAQPDVPYFHWQVEVFIHNAMKVGLNPNWIEILFAYDDEVSKEGRELADRYPYVRFFFYKKSEINKRNHGYIPILRPDILSQHFKLFKNLENEIIFYHDSDIIFRELPDFNKLNSDDKWYFSDTISYIGSKYIKSKSEDLFLNMCNLAGVDKDLIDENNDNSGGAQYLMKGIDYLFWEDVKEVTLKLYKYMSQRESEERARLSEDDLKNYNPIQKWCSDMWAVLWMGLKRGNQIRISDELDFSWATSHSKDWFNSKIYHNAGVVNGLDGEIFYKGDYINKSPWEADFSKISEESNTYNYVEAILYAKKIRASLLKSSY